MVQLLVSLVGHLRGKLFLRLAFLHLSLLGSGPVVLASSVVAGERKSVKGIRLLELVVRLVNQDRLLGSIGAAELALTTEGIIADKQAIATAKQTRKVELIQVKEKLEANFTTAKEIELTKAEKLHSAKVRDKTEVELSLATAAAVEEPKEATKPETANSSKVAYFRALRAVLLFYSVSPVALKSPLEFLFVSSPPQ